MCADNVNSRKSVSEKLEYIRIRLYMMASMPDFEEMLSLKVHLYSDFDFAKEISRRLHISKKSKRNVYQLLSVAKARIKAMENYEDADFYNFMAEEKVKEIERDVEILPENIRKFNIMHAMYL